MDGEKELFKLLYLSRSRCWRRWPSQSFFGNSHSSTQPNHFPTFIFDFFSLAIFINLRKFYQKRKTKQRHNIDRQRDSVSIENCLKTFYGGLSIKIMGYINLTFLYRALISIDRTTDATINDWYYW